MEGLDEDGWDEDHTMEQTDVGPFVDLDGKLIADTVDDYEEVLYPADLSDFIEEGPFVEEEGDGDSFVRASHVSICSAMNTYEREKL